MSLLPPRQQKQLLNTWEISIEKTGGYLYSRLLLAAISTAATLILLLAIGVPFALPLALFMGVISQFIPVIPGHTSLPPFRYLLRYWKKPMDGTYIRNLRFNLSTIRKLCLKPTHHRSHHATSSGNSNRRSFGWQ